MRVFEHVSFSKYHFNRLHSLCLVSLYFSGWVLCKLLQEINLLLSENIFSMHISQIQINNKRVPINFFSNKCVNNYCIYLYNFILLLIIIYLLIICLNVISRIRINYMKFFREIRLIAERTDFSRLFPRSIP